MLHQFNNYLVQNRCENLKNNKRQVEEDFILNTLEEEINIPKINGIKLLQCIKRKKNVPIIILTNKIKEKTKIC